MSTAGKRNTVQYLEVKLVPSIRKGYIRDGRGRTVARAWETEGRNTTSCEPTNGAVRRAALACTALNNTFDGLRALSLCGKNTGA